MLTNLTVTGKTVSGIIAAIGALIVTALGGMDDFMRLLIGLVILDYLTGVAVAIVKRKLSSRIGFVGIIKKMMIFAIVAVGYRIDIAMHTDFVRNMIVFFFVSNEGISFLENSTILGVPYPQQLKKILAQLKEPSPNGGKVDESTTYTE